MEERLQNAVYLFEQDWKSTYFEDRIVGFVAAHLSHVVVVMVIR
jgi:hypothetical protein